MHRSEYGAHPLLKVLDGGERPACHTAVEVLSEVGDLIAERLRGVPYDDPDRGELEALGMAAPPRQAS